jgi:hypothetical protein
VIVYFVDIGELFTLSVHNTFPLQNKTSAVSYCSVYIYLLHITIMCIWPIINLLNCH